MDLPILSAAAVSLVAVLMAPPTGAPIPELDRMTEGATGLVGATLWASEDPIARWGDPVRPEDLTLDDLGPVARIVTDAEGEARAVVVAVGGLWGLGAQEVELGMDRVHLLEAADGSPRLVVDLSADGAAPAPEGLDL
jgi:hypothetical protein